ncbi:MAG: hypothetical protein AAGI38_18940 [Bacteroidota bacterium]
MGVLFAITLSAQVNSPDNQRLTPKSITAGQNTSISAQEYKTLSAQRKAELEELVRNYQRASSSQKAAYQKAIKAKLEELFDLNVRKREGEIQRLEQEIRDVRRSLEIRKLNKDKMVERQLNEVLGGGL